MATAAQTAANQANSKWSSGPKTAAGKERSRCNAVIDGTTGAGVAMLEQDCVLFEERAQSLFSSLKPYNNIEMVFVDGIAYESVMVERCVILEGQCRQRRALTALYMWDDERRADAEMIGMKLANQSGTVCAQLQKTPQGCSWMLERWVGLVAYLQRGDVWTEPQRELALNLLALPDALRAGRTLLDGGDDAESSALRLVVAQAEIARLEHRKAAVVDELDAFNRASALEGTEVDECPELRRVRRHMRRHQRQLEWYQEQFHKNTRLIEPQIAQFRATNNSVAIYASQTHQAWQQALAAEAAAEAEAEAAARARAESPPSGPEASVADFTVGRAPTAEAPAAALDLPAGDPSFTPRVSTYPLSALLDPDPARTAQNRRTEAARQNRPPYGPLPLA